jgi:hypothetical protein
LIDWGEVQNFYLSKDRSQLTVEAPCCDRGLLVS